MADPLLARVSGGSYTAREKEGPLLDVIRPPVPLPLAEPPIRLAVLRSLVACRSFTLAPGTVMFHQGQPRDELIVIEDGALTLCATARSGRRGILAVLGPGEVATEPPGLLHAMRSGDPGAQLEVRALTRSRVMAIGEAALHRAGSRHAEVSEWLASSMRHRADRLARALTRQLCLRLTDRLLETLRDLARVHGRRSATGDPAIALPLTQDLLAEMVGGSRESVNRAVRDLERLGSIRRRGRTYIVPADSPMGASA